MKAGAPNGLELLKELFGANWGGGRGISTGLPVHEALGDMDEGVGRGQKLLRSGLVGRSAGDDREPGIACRAAPEWIPSTTSRDAGMQRASGMGV